MTLFCIYQLGSRKFHIWSDTKLPINLYCPKKKLLNLHYILYYFMNLGTLGCILQLTG